MTTYHYVRNSQSLCKCRELQVKGSSRGAGPKTRCEIVEIIKYDSVRKVLGENLAHGIMGSTLLGSGPPKETFWEDSACG